MTEKLRTSPFQKLLLILSVLVLIALASLTASLPLNLPGEQDSKGTSADGTENLNSGDTAWILVTTLFSFMVGPAFSYLYANIYGKDEHTIVMVSLIASSFITILWIIMTFSLIYGEDANRERILGFPVTFYMFRDVGSAPVESLAPTIPCSLFAVFELGFALLAPAIITAEIIDRVNVFGLIFFLLAWHIVVYCPVAHVLWNPHGFMLLRDVQDFAGGAVVHMLVSATVLAMHLFLTHKDAPNYSVKIPNNSQSALYSALLIWFLSVAMYAGKAHDASPVAAQALVNTFVAVQISVLVGYLVDLCYNREVADTPVSMVNSIMLGLVSAAPGCGYSTVGGAMVSAVVTSIFTKLFARLLLRDGVDPHDPLDVLTIHGIGGSVGFIMTAFTSYAFINPAAENGYFYGVVGLARIQLAGALVMWACAFLAVLILIFLCDLVVPLSGYTDTERVFSPTLSNATPQMQPEQLPELQHTPLMRLSVDGRSSKPFSPEDQYALERDVSLYKKLSHYFGSQRESSMVSSR